mmetsp:Transcript_3323/g.9280  ORF Transcript_3323/g.9280 Transcript_3323/m.9280 type:complete len:245 (-) Transcript_3323:551-1285(-)
MRAMVLSLKHQPRHHDCVRRRLAHAARPPLGRRERRAVHHELLRHRVVRRGGLEATHKCAVAELRLRVRANHAQLVAERQPFGLLLLIRLRHEARDEHSDVQLQASRHVKQPAHDGAVLEAEALSLHLVPNAQRALQRVHVLLLAGQEVATALVTPRCGRHLGCKASPLLKHLPSAINRLRQLRHVERRARALLRHVVLGVDVASGYERVARCLQRARARVRCARRHCCCCGCCGFCGCSCCRG